MYTAQEGLHRETAAFGSLCVLHLNLSVQLSKLPEVMFSSSWCAGTSQFWLPPCSLSHLVPLTHTPALQMLSGHLPFWRDAKNRNPFGIMTSILSEDIKFEGTPWDSISDEARDFVTRLLDRYTHRTLSHYGQSAQFCMTLCNSPQQKVQGLRYHLATACLETSNINA